MAPPPPPPFVSPTPAPDATVVPVGRRRARIGLPLALLLVLIGVGGLVAAVLIIGGSHQPRSTMAGLFGAVTLVAVGVLGSVLFVLFWRQRRTRIFVDQTGLWLDKGERRNVIPWRTLAGICQVRYDGSKTRFYTLELYPTGPIDRDDPVLRTLVREGESFRPGLPHLRYRLRLEASDVHLVAAVVRRYVPHLWLGEFRRRRDGQISRLDRSEHRERTRERGR